MPSPRQLKPVAQQPGRPLYQTVKEAIREAVDVGTFKPGEQMPSTKELSGQLKVSLVTAHRALQELVAAGVLQRAQGRGTFVHQRYHDKTRSVSEYRIGLIFQDGASLADFYHGEVLEGIRRGCQERAADLIHLRLPDDVRNECNGYLYVNPLDEQISALSRRATRRQPVLVVGARSHLKNIAWCDVDNVRLGRMAVEHLASLGHRRIGYVGGAEHLSNSRDRWRGFLEACQALGIVPDEQHVLKGASWKLEAGEQGALLRMLNSARRPTAVFAAGYFFALDAYTAAATVGLSIPSDLSVIGVDDPHSAAYLSPPLTTLRQPLTDLGREAVLALCEHLRQGGRAPLRSRLLEGGLIERRSTAPVRG